jgi:RHS repeat-associated protein
MDVVLTIADTAVYEVVQDSAAPEVLAVMDAVDGIYVLLDEPVAAGGDLADAVTVKRSGSVVDGVTSRINAQTVKWTAADPADWILLGKYEVTSTQLVDLAGKAVDSGPLPVSLTHLAIDAGAVLVVFEAAGDSVPRGESAFGVTSLFQGRGWHDELGLYYYRARWYAPEMVSFLERDPASEVEAQSPYAPMRYNQINRLDPKGESSVSREDILNHLFRRAPGPFAKAEMALDIYAETIMGVKPSDARRTRGLTREFMAGIPHLGLHIGDNLQVWNSGRGWFAIGVFVFETPSRFLESAREPSGEKRWWEKGLETGAGYFGWGASVSVGFNYALNVTDRDNVALYAGRNLMDSWRGYFHELSLSAAPTPAGVSTFWSRSYVGVSGSVGVGSAWALTHAYYRPRLGPIVARSPADVAAVVTIYLSGAHLMPWTRDLAKRWF